jgi:hypothetical protein
MIDDRSGCIRQPETRLPCPATPIHVFGNANLEPSDGVIDRAFGEKIGGNRKAQPFDVSLVVEGKDKFEGFNGRGSRRIAGGQADIPASDVTRLERRSALCEPI